MYIAVLETEPTSKLVVWVPITMSAELWLRAGIAIAMWADVSRNDSKISLEKFEVSSAAKQQNVRHESEKCWLDFYGHHWITESTICCWCALINWLERV